MKLCLPCPLVGPDILETRADRQGAITRKIPAILVTCPALTPPSHANAIVQHISQRRSLAKQNPPFPRMGERHNSKGSLRSTSMTDIASTAHVLGNLASTPRRSYTAVPGFFIQDSAPADTVIPALPPRFGLLDDSPDRWSKFFAQIDRLNQDADEYTSYKVFFFGRHGQGFHNFASAKYGPQAWDTYWGRLNGDDELIWGPDPELTTLGKGEAVDAQDAWAAEQRGAGLPFPERLYCSPMTRALRTCELTFSGLLSDPDPARRRPTILENCREISGVYTCDKRRTRAYIARRFPGFEIEDGLPEDDELWDPELRETDAHLAHRARRVLDHIFEHDKKETFVSVTAHGRIIRMGFLAVVGRPSCILPTGGVLPVVVKSVYTPNAE
ncbi:putative phosphoglycerate mutase family protein [Lyophyllum shimeji]|uniref:Phosphoglycerate mutase family protein n=1 Tax=Lyophyllum shimeji TaxID=47721 RepID=A0A9P3PWX1_LYOSH|nr:putative phosphoglycerate mutase family protein [Lyophyllum shimeji]